MEFRGTAGCAGCACVGTGGCAGGRVGGCKGGAGGCGCGGSFFSDWTGCGEGCTGGCVGGCLEKPALFSTDGAADGCAAFALLSFFLPVSSAESLSFFSFLASSSLRRSSSRSRRSSRFRSSSSSWRLSAGALACGECSVSLAASFATSFSFFLVFASSFSDCDGRLSTTVWLDAGGGDLAAACPALAAALALGVLCTLCSF
mmetsp:Transcript_40192/g.86992  ORF Transcript_40192/g.86992 Transcript_40192/m.86992 type:complete len:202 (-) Transcript_40192:1072-1677(-)